MGVKSKGLAGWGMAALLSVSSLAASGDLRLVEAVQKGDQEAARSLLQQKADVNAAQGDGATALHWAAHRDDLETAELLIRAGANASAANVYGVTALSLACTNRNAAMVEKLLEAGADPKAAQWTGETVLMTCTSTGSVEAVKLLLAHGADLNAKETEQEQTALMWAVAASVVPAAATTGGARNRSRTPAASIRRMRWRFNSLATVASRTLRALSGVGMSAHSSSNQSVAMSSVMPRICG